MPDIRKDLNFLKSQHGFDKKFIDQSLVIDPMKILSSKHKALLPSIDNGKDALHYNHLSVYFNTSRRMPFFAAYNIDGSLKADSTDRENTFIDDPRFEAANQLNDEYDIVSGATDFAKGHMAAHEEMSWGEDAQEKCTLTFFHTNAVPQNGALNGGLWSKLEKYVRGETQENNGSSKISIFTGPVLKSRDPKYIHDPKVRLPLLFFKVVVYKYKGKFKATAFLMSQKKGLTESGMIEIKRTRGIAPSEPFDDYKYKEVFQVSRTLLEKETGLNFKFPNVEWVAVPNDKNQLEVILDIGKTDDIPKRTRGALAKPAPVRYDAKEFFENKRHKAEPHRISLLV